MKKLLGVVVLGLLLSGNAYADSKFDKELKKFSKDNGFVEDLSQLNAIIVTHDKDHYNTPKDYSLFSNLNSVKFINLTESGCKKAEPSKTYHGITLTKCYGEYETKNKNIIKYLKGIF